MVPSHFGVLDAPPWFIGVITRFSLGKAWLFIDYHLVSKMARPKTIAPGRLRPTYSTGHLTDIWPRPISFH